MDLRLRRGFLAMSLEGAGSADASADYDRCLELAGADPRGDEMFSTLISLWAYYLSRGELDRARDTSRRRSAPPWPARAATTAPQNLAGFGMLEWFDGDFRRPRSTRSTRPRGSWRCIGEYGDISPMWFVPIDARSAMHVHLALARFMAGDSAGADASLARAHEITRRASTSRRVRGAPPTRTGSARGCGSSRDASTTADAALAELRTSSDGRTASTAGS